MGQKNQNFFDIWLYLEILVHTSKYQNSEIFLMILGHKIID